MEQHHVILSLGSNTGRITNLSTAVEELKKVFTSSRVTRILLTEPVGIECPWFANQLMAGNTTMELQDFLEAVKHIEKNCGRNERERKRGIIRIDIDMLQYDNERMHLADWSRPYIQALLKEIVT